jgi:hypothetical protein
LRHPFRTLHLVANTRNPVVYHLQVQGLGARNVFPRPDALPPARITALGQAFSEWLISWRRTVGTQDLRYEPDSMILRGGAVVDPPAEQARARDAKIHAWFTTSLGPSDVFIVVWRAGGGRVLAFPLKRTVRRIRRRFSRDH